MDIKAYQVLLDRYERLDECPDSDLSEDDRRSLDFYRAEMQYMRAGHVDDVHAPLKVRKWIVNVAKLDDFNLRYRRAPHKQAYPPRDQAAGEENRLAEWVDYRRGAWDTLCTYQRERLLCIPSFEFDPHGAQWDAQIERYNRFVERVGRAPIVTSDEEEERLAAGWATRVRSRMRQGTLPKHRADEVGALKCWWWEH